MIEAYFSNENEGTSSSCWAGSALYGQLLEKLRLNGLSSEKLMLLYYKDLAESPVGRTTGEQCCVIEHQTFVIFLQAQPHWLLG